MQPPASSTLVTAVLIPLVLWRIVVRFRRASGRQRLSRYRGPISLSVYASLVLLVAWANVHQPGRLLAFAAALAAGAGLATVSLKKTVYQPTSQGLHYTPYAPIGVSLAVLFVARLAWRLVEVSALHPSLPRSAGEFARSPWTIAAFGLLAGYHAWFMLGLVRWRRAVLGRRRRREADGND